MPTTVVRIDDLYKYYRLGVIGGGTLSEDLNRWWKKVRGRPDPLVKIGAPDHEHRKDGQIWALWDINLQIEEGEVLGIIGRNGAGKSTLLKILSRITAPTSGRALIRGRVGSQLEVGTGFHPELTGRENVYLNGAILGMKKAEVTKKLGEIVEFAEISAFIDTPVKRYSSGMLVRLAFSVAAHLEPEILIVDEVLAVGDAAFQNKCLEKIHDVTTKGSNTVIFVSHNMTSIEALCSRAVFLDRGRVAFDGSVSEAINRYGATFSPDRNIKLANRADRRGNALVRFEECYFCDDSGNRLKAIVTGRNVQIVLTYWAERAVRNVCVALNFYEVAGNVLLDFNCVEVMGGLCLSEGEGRLICEIPRFPLRAGQYHGNLYCSINDKVADWIERAFSIDVMDGSFFGTGKLVNQGKFVAPSKWRTAASS